MITWLNTSYPSQSFFYDAYEIGPDAMGYSEINITWNEIKTCLSRQ